VDWYLSDGQPRFSIIPVWVTMSVRSEVLSVYSALASFAGKDRECRPGKESIARRADRSIRFVPKAIRELEAIGAVIVTERPGYTNSYGLPLDPPGDAPVCAPRDAPVCAPRDARVCTPRDAPANTPGMHERASEETIRDTNEENLFPESGLRSQHADRDVAHLRPIQAYAHSLAKEWWDSPCRRPVTGTKLPTIVALIGHALEGGHEPADIIGALDCPNLWTFTDKALDFAISRRRSQIDASISPTMRNAQNLLADQRAEAMALGVSAATADYCGLCACPLNDCDCDASMDVVEVSG
jgi:hypothetical protein